MKKLNSTSPYIIAELSGNHNQSIDRAKEIISAVAHSGAHAVKLQTYTADTMTIPISDGLFKINNPHSLWDGNTLYELYQLAHTPWEWHEELFSHAHSLNLEIFSSPFDNSAVDFLETLNCPYYKVASFENAHHPLLKKIASTGKPVIMSTGLSTLSDLDEAVHVLHEAGCKDLTLLKCTSTYPSSPVNSNLLTIPHMKKLFNCRVGLSDHTMGIGVAVASAALGAEVIEKHVTLCRAEGGVDSAFSLEPDELAQLVHETQCAMQALGTVQYGILEAEKRNLQFKRSIYVVKDINAEEVFTEENISIIRPGGGLAPRYYSEVLGRKARMRLAPGMPVTWSVF